MIKYDKFLESLKSREETNKHVQLKFKMKSLENYCQLHKDDYRIPMIHTEELIQSLQSVSELVDIKKRYVPMSSFDDCLYCYCIRNNLILKFQQIVSKMPQYPTIISHNIFNEPKVSRASSVGTLLWAQAQTTRGKSSISNRTLPPKPNKDIENFDFENFDTFILTFFSILSDHFAENQSLFLILRCASIRILFDLYYTENENIFSVNENQEDFLKKCTDIIELTPKDLKVTEEIIGTDNYLKTFDEIFQEIKSFEIASQQIFMLQFYINPIDMGNAMFVAIENVENGIRKIHNDINFLEISFDDIFTLLIPVFAKSPITCTDSLDRVLKIFSQLKLSISLDYGIISVASVIDQIKKMNEAL